MTPVIEVVSLTELKLETGTCDVCKHEGWVVLVIVSREHPIAFYLCDTHRRDLVERLCAA